jgi:ATP-binding cassette subfamily B protein
MPNPGAPDQKAKSFGPSMRRLLRLLGPHRAMVTVVVILTVISVVLNVICPKLMGVAINRLFAGLMGKTIHLRSGITRADALDYLRQHGQGKVADMLSAMDWVPGIGVDFTAVARILALVLLLYLLGALFGWVQGYLLNLVINRVIRQMRNDVEAKIHRLPLSYFDQAKRGDILSRVTNDVDNMSQSLNQTMSRLLSLLLTIVGVLAMMFWISWELSLIALVTIPLAGVATAQIAKRAKPHFAGQWRNTGLVNAAVEEAYTGHELVAAFGRGREVEVEFDKRNQDLYESSFRASFISGLILPVVTMLGNLNFVAVAVVGGLKVASGTMSLGDVQAFIVYSQQFNQPIMQIGQIVNLMQSGVASAERIFEILDAPEEEPDVTYPGELSGSAGRVEFHDVSFRYQPDTPLIEDLSLVAEPGHVVAIVGPTGAGKTTLVNLIMRFYEVDTGHISVDGINVADMSRDQLRSRVGMVLQDTWLFGGTIRENIAYGNPDATEEQILAAARAAYVDRFVHALPEGYDTVIDEEGTGVSAGEKQLITIARAFLAQPSILILDEATSSVDTRTELLVQQATAALRSDRTSFVIAHRLSTIRDADLIVVMEHGRIVEQGTHQQLLEARGAYYRLYDAQFVGAPADA